MIRWGNLLKIESKQGTVSAGRSNRPLHSKLQAAFLFGWNGAAEQHFVGVDLHGGLLDISNGTLDELRPARPAIALAGN